MSIKMLAHDLYRLQKEVEALERELADLPWDEQDEISEKLRKVKLERDTLRNALDGRLGW